MKRKADKTCLIDCLNANYEIAATTLILLKTFSLVLRDDRGVAFGVLNAYTAFAEILMILGSLRLIVAKASGRNYCKHSNTIFKAKDSITSTWSPAPFKPLAFMRNVGFRLNLSEKTQKIQS